MVQLHILIATSLCTVLAVDPLSPVRSQRRTVPVNKPGALTAVIDRDGDTGHWPPTEVTDEHKEEPCTNQPKLFFLLMANASFPNVEIWRRFLGSAREGTDYRFYIHCMEENTCRDRRSLPRNVFHFVKTVRSAWCDDLVNPMIALLNGALNASCAHANDKFVFISADTVPVKPFKHIHAKLTQADAQSSSICIQPWDEWGLDARTGHAVVKHSQWLTLSRKHAKEAVAKWVAPQSDRSFLDLADEDDEPEIKNMHHSHSKRNAKAMGFPVDNGGSFDDMNGVMPLVWSPFPKIFAESRAWPKISSFFGVRPKAQGCLDEFYFFRTLYGDLVSDAPQNISGLLKGRLQLTEETRISHQGQCDTFAAITDDRTNVRGVFQAETELLQTDLDTNISFPMYHAAGFRRLSNISLLMLRNSSFLFARKFDENSTFAGEHSLPEAFDYHVFSK